MEIVLELPSVIVRTEPNYLLNPAHPGFQRIKAGKPTPFAFDPRLLESPRAVSSAERMTSPERKSG